MREIPVVPEWAQRMSNMFDQERKKTGPKPRLSKEESEKRKVFRQQRNQAKFRNEDWNLPYDDWNIFWGEDYHLRGRKAGNLIMKRVDIAMPWQLDNIEKYLYTGSSICQR